MNRRLKLDVMGGKKATWKRVRQLYAANILQYLILDELSGAIAYDKSAKTNGAYSGASLGASTSLSGKKCPTFDGDKDIVNLYPVTGFDGKEGTVFIELSHTAEYWTDGVARYDFCIYPNTDNYLYIGKAADGTYKGAYKAGATVKTAPLPVGSVNRMVVAITWSLAGGFVKSYLNGTIRITATGVGTWADPALVSTTCVIGGLNTSGANSGLIGSASDYILFNRVLTDAEILAYYKLICRSYKTISIIGDSISANMVTNWHTNVTATLNTGKCITQNHAVSGNSIMSHMDAQVAAAVNDNADIIVMELGRNDNNAGNMTALQAEVEENIAELKISNPNSTIYYLNVLPTWTDTTGATEVDMSNIRTAIAAACTAQDITCWDTYTTPWIAANETSDGTHPTAAGHAKIAIQVLARL